MIKLSISIDQDKLNHYKEIVFHWFMSKRAYIGYCAYLEKERELDGTITIPSYEFFTKLEYFKIKLAFKQYWVYIRGVDYKSYQLTFRKLILNLK